MLDRKALRRFCGLVSIFFHNNVKETDMISGLAK